MNRVIFVVLLLLSPVLVAHADDTTTLKDGDKIYQQNSFGRTQYHKEHYTVEGNRLVPTNSFGQKQYHKPGYAIEKGKVYETDSLSRTQYHKPGFKKE
jgi:hypothetical protein